VILSDRNDDVAIVSLLLGRETALVMTCLLFETPAHHLA